MRFAVGDISSDGIGALEFNLLSAPSEPEYLSPQPRIPVLALR